MGSVKIVYILENFPSPTEYFILNEILFLQRKGFKITILVLRKQKKYSKLPELKELSSSIIYLPAIFFYLPVIAFFLHPFSFVKLVVSNISELSLSPRGLLKIIRYLGISIFFSKKLRDNPPDHVHAHFAFIGVDIAYYLCGLLDVNYSFTAHAKDIYTNKKNIIKHARSSLFVVTCTNYNQEYINNLTQHVYRSKIYRCYHGITIQKWPFKPLGQKRNDKIRILTIARLIEKKGLIYLLKAIKRLVHQRIDVHCTIIGEGKLRKHLLSCIQELNIVNYVDLYPFVVQEKIRDFFSRSALFVLPSTVSTNGDRDGLPNVILEAMLSGVPVITTPVSALPEIVEHLKTGILVDDKDDLEIANAIITLMGNKRLYNEIARTARNRILEKFDIEDCCNLFIDVFQKYLSPSKT
jgi:colanic acid/amylovoran biosynthesis glycosyltransferase